MTRHCVLIRDYLVVAAGRYTGGSSPRRRSRVLAIWQCPYVGQPRVTYRHSVGRSSGRAAIGALPACGVSGTSRLVSWCLEINPHGFSTGTARQRHQRPDRTSSTPPLAPSFRGDETASVRAPPVVARRHDRSRGGRPGGQRLRLPFRRSSSTRSARSCQALRDWRHMSSTVRVDEHHCDAHLRPGTAFLHVVEAPDDDWDQGRNHAARRGLRRDALLQCRSTRRATLGHRRSERRSFAAAFRLDGDIVIERKVVLKS